jgi:NAD(P)-dependent dehydrogenase (short-subunit alcohol dehydrogenase family)
LLAELAEQYPQRVSTIALDLGERGAPEWVIDEAIRLRGGIDELVCAAGIVRYTAVGHVREVELHEQLAVNFVAPFLMTQRAGTHMRACGRGAVVLVSSTLAQHPAAQTAAYSASKAALVAATRSFALELAPVVRVNALAPGVVDTDMVRVPREHAPIDPTERAQSVAAQLEKLRALHPLGRLGTAQDIADAALFLLEATWMSGTVLTIDGGLSVR